MIISDTRLKLEKNRQDLHDLNELLSKPQSFEINGQIFEHQADSEHFNLKDTEEFYTPLRLMKLITPAETRSLYKQIIPPAELYKLGNASRRKVMRLVQLNTQIPAATPATKQLTELMEYLANTEFTGSHFGFNTQWSATQWALNRLGMKNADLVASTLIHYGAAPDYRAEQMLGDSIHTIEQQKDGILISIDAKHEVRERFEAACSYVRALFNRVPTTSYQELLRTGFVIFHTHQQTLISCTRNYHMKVEAVMQRYCRELYGNLDPTNPPEVPFLEEPPYLLPDEEIFLPYSDFKFKQGATVVQLMHLNDLHDSQAQDVLREKLKDIDVTREFKRKDLIEIGLNDKNLKAGVDKGFLLKPKYGIYTISPTLFAEKLALDGSEEEAPEPVLDY